MLRAQASNLSARAPWRRAVTSSVVICGMPRSGTGLLAGLLASTKLIGYPREYFHPGKQPPGARDDYGAFVARTIARHSRRGVFGAKFIDDQLDQFVSALRSLPGNGILDDRELLERTLPSPKYVWLRRRDVVAEAVSLWKAHETGVWAVSRRSPWKATRIAPDFDLEQIEKCHLEIVRGNDAREAWFAENGIEPLRVVYEELDENHAEVTRRVLAFVGIDVPARFRISAQTVRQSGAADGELIARYHSSVAARAKPGLAPHALHGDLAAGL
jgi:LPS sulfotransferase NodH